MTKDETKFIAWYLPQYHEIPENNKWWGEGFTEWANVKKAMPRFKNHYQPREPLEDNYYSLDNLETLKWQARLMEQYNIYGLCFYHYWFKNGKKLLEKPAELLLNNKDVHMPFCFSWANEPWTRAWDGKSGEVIMPQEYGGEKEWRDHYEYLKPFFEDHRYIKMEGKPVFVIYKSELIPDVKEMIIYWDNLAKQDGFDGIYFINTLRNGNSFKNSSAFNSNVEFEPFYSTSNLVKACDRFRRKFKGVQLTRSYDHITRKSISKIPKHNMKTIPGIFVDWDNTARKDPAFIMKGFSLEKFSRYVEKKVKKGKKVYNSEFMFINAWNEWAEGTYLEPDKKYGHSILSILKKVNE